MCDDDDERILILYKSMKNINRIIQVTTCVQKEKEEIYYTCTYIFINFQQQQQQENHDTAFNKKCTISIHYESLQHSMYGKKN